MEILAHMRLALQEQEQMLARIREEDIQHMVDCIAQSKRIFVAGAGRSGLIMRTFCMRCMHMGMQAYVVGETVTPRICEGDMLLIGSGSGETQSLAGMAQKAKALGVSVGLITIYPQSTIGQCADTVVALPGTTKKSGNLPVVHSMQPSGNLFEQTMFLLLDSMVVALLEQRGFAADDLFERHANLE